MNHPEHILRTLDSHLTKPVRLILYGRAALALGFPDPQPQFHATMGVDAILPAVDMAAIEADDAFWTAIEKTNAQLQSTGLYLTHLFEDSQVILRPDWLEHLVPIDLSNLSYLQLSRPSTQDLILTKMMRVDPQDRNDIVFLLEQLNGKANDIETILSSARIPDIPEIVEAFEVNSTWLREHISQV